MTLVALVASGVAATPAAAAPAPAGAWTRPVDGPVVRGFDAPTSRYGPGHRGADLAVPDGTPVRAAGDGVVTFAGVVAGTLHVVVAHAGDLRTSYSFLAVAAVRRGEVVHRGDVIGTTGGPTGAHPAGFHLGLRRGDDYLDPMLLFGPPDLTRVVHLAPVGHADPPSGGSWAVEALGIRRGLGVELPTVVHPPGGPRPDGSGGVSERVLGWLQGGMAAVRSLGPTVPGASDAAAVATRALELSTAGQDCTAAPPAADGRGGSGHLLMAVGGIDSSTDRRTGATFALPSAALGYRADEVHWFSYAPRGGPYSAADTHGPIRAAARRLAAQLRALHALEPGREVDLLGHSQGGVVVDAFLLHEYDAADPSFPPLGTVVTLSSPHEGAPLATAAARVGATRSGPRGARRRVRRRPPGDRGLDRRPPGGLGHDPIDPAPAAARPRRSHHDRGRRRRRRACVPHPGPRRDAGRGGPRRAERPRRGRPRPRGPRRRSPRARGPAAALPGGRGRAAGGGGAGGDHPARARGRDRGSGRGGGRRRRGRGPAVTRPSRTVPREEEFSNRTSRAAGPPDPRSCPGPGRAGVRPVHCTPTRPFSTGISHARGRRPHQWWRHPWSSPPRPGARTRADAQPMEGVRPVAVVTMKQLLEAGVHFGHQTRRWDPKMKRFIFGERNGIYIIDLQQTLERIDTAYRFVRKTVEDGGSVLFVGTKKQAQEPIQREADRAGMPYVNFRWLGGMMTNFSTVHARVAKLKELEKMVADRRDRADDQEGRPEGQARGREAAAQPRRHPEPRAAPERALRDRHQEGAHRGHRGEPPRHPGRRRRRHELQPRRDRLRDPGQRRRDPLREPHVPRARRRVPGGPLPRPEEGRPPRRQEPRSAAPPQPKPLSAEEERARAEQQARARAEAAAAQVEREKRLLVAAEKAKKIKSVPPQEDVTKDDAAAVSEVQESAGPKANRG